MNMTAGFYFLILLLGLILCSFLGGYKEGMYGVDPGNTSTAAYFTPEPKNTFAGSNQNNQGATAYYSSNGDGTYTVVKVDTSGQISAYNASKNIKDNTIVKQIEDVVKPGSLKMEMFASSTGNLSIIHVSPGNDYVEISNPSDSSLPSMYTYTNDPNAHGYIGALTAIKAPTIIQPGQSRSSGSSTSSSQAIQGTQTFGTPITGPAGSSSTISTPTNPGVIPILASVLSNISRSQNYNHYTKTSLPTQFYGPGGSIITVIQANNTISMTVTMGGKTFVYSQTSVDSTGNPIYGTNDPIASGTTIQVATDSYGNPILNLLDTNGKIRGTATANPPNSTNTNYATNTVNTPQQSYNSPNYSSGYNAPPIYGGSYPPTYMMNPNGQSVSYPAPTGPVNVTSMNSNGQYNNLLPSGIPRSMIPPGDEDLYILKSSVVPPVCPSCPAPIVAASKATSSSASSNTDTSSCPACPACARCPEPSFTCQKVPNYTKGANNAVLPTPVMGSGYSTYGM